jgi:hypothetical protein
MSVRNFALVYGIVFLLVAIAGFIPGFVMPFETEHPELAVESGGGTLFGLFPINVLHNLVHGVFGVWGLLASRSASASIAYARAVAVIYGVLVIMGLVPGLQTTFGLIPLWGHDVWLHLVLAAVAAYFGWAARAETGAAASS